QVHGQGACFHCLSLAGRTCANRMRPVPYSEREGHSIQGEVRPLHRLPRGPPCRPVCWSAYFNACDRCHMLEGYRPSTFSLAKHKETRFVLTGGHVAVPCAECHKQSAEVQPEPTVLYHWKDLNCTSCHADPHKGQFKERMQLTRANGSPAGCEACHTTKAWKELSGFDHAQTKFALLGAHRATAC